jgi:hypothetical protein
VPLNLIARDTRATLLSPTGDNPLQLRPRIISGEITNQREDLSGLLKTTATLTLSTGPLPSWVESLDPLLNPSRWARGSQLDIEIFDGTNWVVHPRGALTLLQVPAYNPGSPLQLQLGCDLTYLDQESPTTTVPRFEVEFGDTFRRDTAITHIATAIGLPPLEDEIEEYPLFFVPRNADGNYIRQLGELAYGAGGYYLWIDGLRQLRATKPIPTAAPTYIVSRATDAASFERRQGEEASAETVQVIGTGTGRLIVNVTDVARPSRPLQEGTILVQVEDPEADKQKITTTQLLPLSKLFPASDKFGEDNTLTPAVTTTTENKYDLDGILTEVIETQRSPRGYILPEFFEDDLTLTPAKEIRTTYIYEEGVTQSITRTTRQPIGLVNFDVANPLSPLVLTNEDSQDWEPKDDGYWLRIDSRFDLLSGNSDTTGTLDKNPPPEPIRKAPSTAEQETPLSGTATFDQPGLISAAYRRTRVYRSTITLTNPTAATELALLEGQLLYGRTLPATWVTAIPDLTSYQPFQIWQWEDSGLTTQYMPDAEVWAFDQTTATYGVDGLLTNLVLTDAEDTPYLQPPYSIPAAATLTSPSSIIASPDLQGIPLNLILSISSPSTISPSPDLPFILFEPLTLTSPSSIDADPGIAAPVLVGTITGTEATPDQQIVVVQPVTESLDYRDVTVVIPTP